MDILGSQDGTGEQIESSHSRYMPGLRIGKHNGNESLRCVLSS